MDDGQTHRVSPLSSSHTFASRTAESDAQSADGNETEGANCIEISSESGCSALSKAILDPERDYPIVCLTARPGELYPALPAAAVREIAGPEIPIYFVPTRRLTRYLSDLLPARFDVWDGATRVWWPGVSEFSDHMAHPRIYDPSGSYGEDSLRRLAAELSVPEHPELTVKQQLVLAERQRSALAERAGGLERTLAETRRERDEALRGISPASGQTAQENPAKSAAAEADARQAGDPSEQETGQPERAESDLEGALYKLIFSEWVDICPPDERGERPPRRFLLHRDLVRTIAQRRVDVPIERIAWVCAMVIGDRATGHASIDAHIYRGSEETERDDGAKAMRAALKRSAGGPRLHYFSLPNGTIEFVQIGYHDMSLG
ncbi:MAG TPA: hypothetical protein VGX26_01675 [Solirubrobacteraceae bacterium]|jgi:hypothetical protein|nr:hypothetical protein [Solirubrobacteraceae bacterium]